MGLDHPGRLCQFMASEATIDRKSNGIEPELGRRVVPPDVNVRRFVRFVTVEV